MKIRIHSLKLFNIKFTFVLEYISFKEKFDQVIKEVMWFKRSVVNWLNPKDYYCKNGHSVKHRTFYPYNNNYLKQCHCGEDMRLPGKSFKVYGINPMHEYYDVGLGQVVKGRLHRKQIIKQQKLYEVGDDWDSMKEYIDKRKRSEEEQEIKRDNEEMMREISYLESKHR